MLSSMPFGRQQDSRNDMEEARRHSLPATSISAQLLHAQQLYSASLAASVTIDDAAVSQHPRIGNAGFLATNSPFAYPNGDPFQADSRHNFASMQQQQHDLESLTQFITQHGGLPSHTFNAANFWNLTQGDASSSSQTQRATTSHGFPTTELPHGEDSSTSSAQTHSNHNFTFASLPGPSQPIPSAHNYYGHYLHEPSLANHTNQLESTSIPPLMSSMPSHDDHDALHAFASAMQASTLANPASHSLQSGDSPFGSPDSEDASAHTGDKKKSARRQGVTCDQCRTKHLRCDLDDRRVEAARSSSPDTAEAALAEMERSSSTGTAIHSIRCTRCEEKGFVCTKTHAPPSRRYPRPSRSGKRIEQARMLHGADTTAAKSSVERINASTILIRALTELRGAEVRITDRVMAGSLSIQLLNCFFAVCHMQAPVVDFGHFSKTFNAANGDPRKMSIMSNGGSVAEGIPSHIPEVQGITSLTWPDTKESKIGTPGTTETLLAVLHAWAAHYTEAPIAFGPGFKDLDTVDVRLQEVDDNGLVESSYEPRDADGSKAGVKRPKRKQGVACDTCRLRRVRCDITERPDGMGCSRCADKRIKCTDTYIQTKRAKLLAKEGKGNKGEVSSEDLASAANGAAPDANRLSPRGWISSRSEGLIRSYRRGDIEHNLRRGKARKAFCHALLNHALSLVHKYDLLKKPSVESVQILCLLTPLLDNADGVQAHYFSDTACSHAEKLGMSTKLVVDETDRNAVEHMLSTMQSHRIYLTAWCRDAIVSGLNRRKTFYREDRAIEVVGQASFRNEAKSVQTPRQGEVVLSGEMGLTFVIMTMVQIGALSRFVATHVDCVETMKPSIPSWQRPLGSSIAPVPRADRFSPRPSLSEMRKLERACEAVWKSLDSLMLFFDRCASKAWSTMNSLQPFRPLGWVVCTKLCGSLLYLALFRALGERYRANAAFMATLSHTLGGYSAIPEEDKAVAASLKALFDKSMQRATVSCRKTARLIGILLPLGILQTGGPVLKQIFPVAQFLAKIPSVSDEQVNHRMNGRDVATVGDPHSAPSPLDSSNFIDPQALQQQQQQLVEQLVANEGQRENAAAHSHYNESLSDPSTSAHIDVLRQLEGMHSLQLGPYTHTAKKNEVESLMEGLSQLGYAWDSIDRELGVIQDLLRAANQASGST